MNYFVRNHMENPDDYTERNHMENPDDHTERKHMENPDDRKNEITWKIRMIARTKSYGKSR